MENWKKTKIVGNDGKSLISHQWVEYTVCLNVNNGLRGPGQKDSSGAHWMFEVECKGRRVGEAVTLSGAKKLAEEHEKLLRK